MNSHSQGPTAAGGTSWGSDRDLTRRYSNSDNHLYRVATCAKHQADSNSPDSSARGDCY